MSINRISSKFILPIEALSALAIIGAVYTVTGWAIRANQYFENDGKPRRWDVDTWDRRMMERDSRITGNVNRQQANVEAPPQFARNSALELEPRLF